MPKISGEKLLRWRQLAQSVISADYVAGRHSSVLGCPIVELPTGRAVGVFYGDKELAENRALFFVHAPLAIVTLVEEVERLRDNARRQKKAAKEIVDDTD
jgi:hypothetical protein